VRDVGYLRITPAEVIDRERIIDLDAIAFAQWGALFDVQLQVGILLDPIGV
jgi:hypothetical protein